MYPFATTNIVHPLRLNLVSVDSLLDCAGSPLATPHLHPEAAALLLSKADQAPRRAALRIEFSVPAADLGRTQEVRAATQAQFTRTQEEAHRQLGSIFRNGRVAATTGLLFVIVLLGGVQAVVQLTSHTMVKAVSESLTVFAWVAMWRPAELLLYEHWPVRRKRRLAQRLAQAEVVLVDTAAQSAG